MLLPLSARFPFSNSEICQAIASPSRSGSGASKMLSTSAAALAIASTCLLLRAMVSYCIAKLLSGSTAPVLGTRSRTWPYDANTSKSLPRYFFSVLALAGDSTISKLCAMLLSRTASVQAGAVRHEHVFHQHGVQFLAQVPQHHQRNQLDLV